MKVSIIVPIYNVEQYLAKCIESLIHQTYGNLEILLVNDGSKDHCDQIMEEYAAKDHRIVCLYKENGGLSDARNYGLNYATGEYCLFVDSDDTLALDAIELCVKKVEETQAEVVVFDMMYVYSDHTTNASGGDFDQLSFADNPEVILINNSACNKMFKTSLFKDIQFPRGMWYEDLATIPVVMAKAKSVVKLNANLYYYLQRESSIAHTINEKVFDIYKAIRMIENAFEGHQISKEVQKMYIQHGLFLTTLRIKDSSDDFVTYMKKNIQCLDEYFPAWRTYQDFGMYSIKARLVFWLLQHNQLWCVKLLYRK
ncbi:MAG: glycosyltransferase family 2 protein [Erysipelotrichaceae bacterium]|nr:glycosyltransferase family 2 protein [Erysipelotrichaceae bacterium]